MLFFAFAIVFGIPIRANHIIFRLDDVQDWWLSSHSQAIIKKFIEKDMPLSIGVLGGKFFGEDKAILEVVTDAYENHEHEVFNHGDDATTLFNQISKDEAKKHIMAGEEDPFKSSYESFVPHENRWTQSTLEALKELGYRTISASISGNFPMSPKLTGDLLQMPQHTATGIYNGGTWVSGISDVISDCIQAMDEFGFCVVMMHPQEFEKAVTLQELDSLLEAVKTKEWMVVTFKEYAALQDSEPVQELTSPPVDLANPVKTNSKLTMYWVSFESNFNGEKTKELKDCKGNVMTMVDPEFWEAANMEGTGILNDGRVFNLGEHVGCFMWLNPKTEPYGVNHKGWGLIPYVSLAANLENELPTGSKVFIPAFVGVELPGTGGKKHNGCFRMDDIGWSFDDGANHIDWFVARKDYYKELANDCHGFDCFGKQIDIYGDQDCELIPYLPGSVITKVPDPNSDCITLWEQCGGNGHSGSICCQIGECMMMDNTWSQCRTGLCPDGWDCHEATPKPTPQFPTAKPTLPGNAHESIIFRLDDVQDYYLSANVKEILDVFMQRNMPLSIGVIGGSFYGTDPSLHEKIMEAVESFDAEVFNHGDDATTFFNQVDKTEAKTHIANGEESEFKKYRSFVPHQNRWNDATVEALAELGYSVISASKGGAFPMPVNLQGKVKMMPQHTETAEYDGGAWTSTISNVMGDCEKAVEVDGFCVVMMHPQEFQKGTVTISDLEELLDSVSRNTEWKVTTFKNLARSVNPLVLPTPEPTKAPTDVPKYYPHWGQGKCVNDGKEAEWVKDLYNGLEACCQAHFNWKKAECMQGAPTTSVPSRHPTHLIVPTNVPTSIITSQNPTPVPSEASATSSPTVQSVYGLYTEFCKSLDTKKRCKKPCMWTGAGCSPRPKKKVKCKKFPKKSSICALVGCTLNKRKKCTGSVDWTL